LTRKEPISLPTSRKAVLPQSLSSLPIEVIELICDILKSDNTSEIHSLHPKYIGENLKRRKTGQKVLHRSPLYPTPFIYPSSLKRQWHGFIEQAIYDVFRNPESLLQTFSNDDRTLFDSQTLWYIMLCMTRTTPSLVFDALWIAMGDLFLPPEGVGNGRSALSNAEVASMISLGLHALVATAPLVYGERQLGNMSRIRSKGLVLDDLEPVALCLAYEDAFSTELALRLARRIFSAIPIRRAFAETLASRADGKEIIVPDILQTVLELTRTVDLENSSALKFSDHEINLHEKRVPYLILDWARTVMLQDWDGAAEIPSTGPFGGALAMISALCKIPHLLQQPNS